MNKLKVVTIIGTRPEIIRLSRVVEKLDICFEHILVHTGQNYDYELNEIFYEDLEIKSPDYYLDSASSSPSKYIGQVIQSVDEILEKEKPDAVLILGDTNSALSVIPAKKRHIPIFHMEAGNRCFDQRVPEEINRKIVDHISDINMPYSTIAREYLLKEGFPSNQIIKTGSPMYEVLSHYKTKIDNSTILKKLEISPNNYFVVSCHREENIDISSRFLKLVDLLNYLAEDCGKIVKVSTHPRTRKRFKSEKIVLSPKVDLIKPIGFTDYINLQMNSIAVLSDSGTITEESSILNFNALNIRYAHERPEGMEEAAVMMTGLELPLITNALDILKIQSNSKKSKRKFKIVDDYKSENVSDKVARIILSHTDFINRNIWKKFNE